MLSRQQWAHLFWWVSLALIVVEADLRADTLEQKDIITPAWLEIVSDACSYPLLWKYYYEFMF